jgi:hypothetical protein
MNNGGTPSQRGSEREQEGKGVLTLQEAHHLQTATGPGMHHLANTLHERTPSRRVRGVASAGSRPAFTIFKRASADIFTFLK